MHRRVFLFVLVLSLALSFASAAWAAAAPSATRQAALRSLKGQSQAASTFKLDPSSGAVAWLTGRWQADDPADLTASARSFLEANKAAFGLAAPLAQFRVAGSAGDDLLPGWRDVYLQQRIGDLPVLGKLLGFHYDGNGRLIAVSGDYVPGAARPQVARLSVSAAARRALEAATTLPSQKPGVLKSGTKGFALAKAPAARLVYFVDVTGAPRLSYEFTLVGSGVGQSWRLVVDARSGAVLSRVSTIETAARGIDLSGRKVSLHTTYAGGRYRLIDRTEYMLRHHSKHPYTAWEGCIEVRDNQHSDKSRTNSPVVTDADNNFTGGGSNPKLNVRSAVSLARNLETTYKAVRTRLGRNSVDGKGLALVGNVHLGKNYENAFWDGTHKMMYFGDNAAGQMPFAKSLDTVAHEFGHGITRYSVAGGGFVYAYPSGALSEAISDIWGCMVDARDWQMGEDLGAPLRDLATPALNGLPATMLEYQVMVLPLDNGGNHVDCTIGGHFFERLSAALPAVAPAHDGRFSAARIVYRSYKYLTPQSSYRDWAFGLAQAATDLYGAGSAQAAATRAVLAELSMDSVDFGQNDNGWCLDAQDKVTEMQWSRAAGMCYLAEKFTTPAGARLARLYLALDPDANYTFIAPGQALRVFVVPVAPDGGPDMDTVLDYETLSWDAIAQAGNFTPATMTLDDYVTPRHVDLPAQFFVLVGFRPDDADESTMLLLQDDGTTPGPADQNWVISAGVNWNDFSYYWIKQTLSQYSGHANPANFMIRPMYWYGNVAPTKATTAVAKGSLSVAGASRVTPAP